MDQKNAPDWRDQKDHAAGILGSDNREPSPAGPRVESNGSAASRRIVQEPNIGGDDGLAIAASEADQHPEAMGLGETAKEAARATLKAVSEQASALTSSVADELTTSAEAEKGRGADAMLGFAKAIQSAAGELDDQSPQIARAFRGAARSVENLSQNLRGESIGGLFATGSDYAKRQPLVFFAGAVVAGFAVSRFLLSHKPGRTSAPDSSADGATAGLGER